jgi:hypothetical protein
MDILSTAILVIGVPFSLASFLLIRRWAKIQNELPRKGPRASYRADLMNRDVRYS